MTLKNAKQLDVLITSLLLEGQHQGIYFNDSDVFKVIECDAELETYIDNLIVKIAASQEDDGYLYTIRTINPNKLPVEWVGKERWSRLIYSHELYNVGHMYEAAVAYYQATGKRSLLNVALKNADMIANTFPTGYTYYTILQYRVWSAYGLMCRDRGQFQLNLL
jgi:uncharacterized protein